MKKVLCFYWLMSILVLDFILCSLYWIYSANQRTRAGDLLPNLNVRLNVGEDASDQREMWCIECTKANNPENYVPLYVITPTYPRAEQIPELTRLAQTLLHVKNVVWIVCDEAPVPTKSVISYLNIQPINIVYLRVEMPKQYLNAKIKPRGVANRLAGLEWVRNNAKEGVLYFADDDNTYDIRIFDDIRTTREVSMFPVGLVAKYGVSSPIVVKGKVIDFYDGWRGGRKFPVDMAGFAVNVAYLKRHPQATMPYQVGYEEDGFLKSLNLSLEDIEPKAGNCTKVCGHSFHFK